MGPLDHPGLRLIEDQIDRGELERAQQLLAALDDRAVSRHGTSYLATRLLFERGRLDRHGVAERLRDLLKAVAKFPEAEVMLRDAESGSLTRRSIEPSVEQPPRPALDTTESIEALFKESRSAAPSLPIIPKAPALPHFTPSPDRSPSYSPPEEYRPPSLSPPPAPLPFALRHPTVNDDDRALSTTRPPQAETRPIRSGPPPALDEPVSLSVIDIAALLDEGRYDEALRSVERSGVTGPDMQLLRARALHGEGRREEALSALEPLCQAPLLEPELRGSCARLLVELDELDRALDQSERAHHDEPDSLFLRLTLAWSKLRLLRRNGERRYLEEAERLLEGIQARSLPMPALVLALRACIQAHVGDAERATILAQRALALDSRSADALWALGLASARLDRGHDAKQAFLRLLNVSLVEARLLRAELLSLGSPITDAPRAPSADAGPDTLKLWHPLENALLASDRPQVVIGIEQMCRERLAAFAESLAQDDFSALASDAAGFFSTAPVFHHFAPFDLSLWSIARIAAILDLMYGVEPRSTATDDTALVTLLGAYVGESVRRSRSGIWTGSPRNLESGCVASDDRKWRPFDLVQARLRRGLKLAVDETIALSRPGMDPWNQRVQPAISPPVPWGPNGWPEIKRVEQLGRALARSVIGLYCREIAETPLDFSFTSLRALDRYLALVAPPGAPLDDDPVWARRLAVMLGAYLGETLREASFGHWHHDTCARVEADAYVILLADVSAVTPVTQVMARVLGDTEQSLFDFANDLFKR